MKKCFYLLTLEDEAIAFPTKAKINLKPLKSFKTAKFITFVICSFVVRLVEDRYELDFLSGLALMLALVYVVLNVSINIIALISKEPFKEANEKEENNNENI